MYNVELHVVGGKHAGQVIPLDRKKFLIGRETDCQLRPNSELVSRHHCVFTVDDFSARLRDLGSTNGTMVNGERIRKEVVLQPGDNVIVGSLEFRVVVKEGEGVKDDNSDVTGNLSAVSEETVVAGADTLTEMQPIQTPNTEMPAQQPAPEQTIAPDAQASAAPAPAQPVEAVPQMPGGNVGGDTTVIAQQPMMMPGQVPYQPMMQQPMGYPQMYGGYPYAGMPGQMPMYPQQQPYPGQQMPGYPDQQQPQQVAEQPQPAAETTAVSLPDPSETGAKPPEPKPAAAEGESAAPINPAAAIIQQHRNRRPGG